MSHVCQFTQDFGQKQQDVFRLYVGQGRRFGYQALADATNIPKSSLESYATGTAMPMHVALRLIAALPPEAGDMLIEQSGYRLRPIHCENGPWDAIGAEASLLTYELFDARSDGYIDHREAAKLRERCRTLDAKLAGVLE
jgi:hypothetical protein